ncbi:hypothetical protein FRC09_011089 [Ceratobasidium sp. 395]|nr:hypothetical protein FRC09_011089 [Ceratobasidium sp. 395]
MSLPSSTNSFSSYEHVADIASQRSASPPPSELADADESMSDLMSAILRSSSSEYSMSDSEDSESDSDYAPGVHEDQASVVESIASTAENPDAINADDKEPSSDGFEYRPDGSPRDSLTFEGNIWTNIAESDSGVAEVNEGFRIIFEQERIKLEVKFRRDTRMRTNEGSTRDHTCQLEVTYHCSTGARAGELVVSRSDVQDAITPPVEELPSSEPKRKERQVDNPEVGSPMSLDYFSE